MYYLFFIKQTISQNETLNRTLTEIHSALKSTLDGGDISIGQKQVHRLHFSINIFVLECFIFFHLLTGV